MATNILMLTDNEAKLFDLIQANETDKAIELISNGDVRINCLDKNGMNFLDQAAFKGNERLAKLLIEMGADPDNRKHAHRYTSLMFAALSGKPKLCEMLLNAGAQSYVTNNMNKTASEMAAFVGNFECVSLINSYITYYDIDVIVHPNGEKSDTIYPKEFVEYIHQLTRTHFIHPVSIINSLLITPFVLEHRKKLVYVVDRLFEKQLRCKQPNEILSLKLWVVLATLREISDFVQTKQSEEEVRHALKSLIRHITEWKNVNGKIYRKKLEVFLSSIMAAFPYKHSVIYKALADSMKHLEFGRAPTTFKLICGTLFGQRYAQSTFCSYCGQANSIKCCSACRVVYCSVECQKSDWSSHKNICNAIKADPSQNAYLTVSDEEIVTLTLNDQKEE